MSQQEILAALTPVAEALERLGVHYHIGGSVASSALGVARTTLDVDIVADLRDEHVLPLCRELADRYYIEREMIEEALRHQSSFNLVHLESMLKVVFVLKAREFDRAAFARARPMPLDTASGSREFPVASAEDIVLHKLRWYLAGDQISERQWHDVLGVLRVQTRLDDAYLDTWATRLGLADLLARARREAR